MCPLYSSFPWFVVRLWSVHEITCVCVCVVGVAMLSFLYVGFLSDVQQHGVGICRYVRLDREYDI